MCCIYIPNRKMKHIITDTICRVVEATQHQQRSDVNDEVATSVEPYRSFHLPYFAFTD